VATPFTLIGVYDADGTTMGEIRYWIGARFGRTHCSLCDITHGLFREKAEWRSCRESMDVEVTTFHRDDAPSDVLGLADGLPVVAARVGDEVVVVLDALQLDQIHGDSDLFLERLSNSCERLGLGAISQRLT
jgi:hypothetical protein